MKALQGPRRQLAMAALGLLSLAGRALAAPTPRPAPASSPSAMDAPPKLATATLYAAPIPVEKITSGGVRVVTLPRHALPLVSVLVTVRAGASVDPPGQPGLAAAVAMMLADGGAGARSEAAIYEAIEGLGDELHVDVDPDGVRMALTVQKQRLPAALSILADLVARPRFDPLEWPRARDRRIAELIKERTEPRHIADLVFLGAVYGEAHPYGHPPHGTPTSLAAMRADDLKAFWSAHYRPPATSFVLVGDVDPDEAARLIETDLGGYSGGASLAAAAVSSIPPAVRRVPPAASPPRASSSPRARVLLVDRPGSPQAEVRVGGLGLARRDAEVPAADLVEMVLGGSFTSRLVQNLREKHGYTYGVSARFRPWDAPGPFVIKSAIRTDVTGPAIAEILAELGRMQAPVAASELDKARALVGSKLVDEFAAAEEAAQLEADLVVHGLPLDTWTRQPALIAALRPAALLGVARRLLRPAAATIVIVGDRAKIEPQLRALPFGKTIEVVDEDGRPKE